MSDDYIKAAFFEVCTEAETAERHFVSLYCNHRFYGGPEEGGWYGTDTTLVASQEVPTEADAVTMQAAAVDLAEKLTKQAEDVRNRHYAAQLEWLEARGLDADFLPEPDGGDSFWVATETVRGSFVSEGDRCYS